MPGRIDSDNDDQPASLPLLIVTPDPPRNGIVNGHGHASDIQLGSLFHSDDILGNHLRAGGTERSDLSDPSLIWSEKQLKQILTKKRLEDAFRSYKFADFADKVDVIMARYFKILAILALMSKIKLLRVFMKHGIDDLVLPLQKYPIEGGAFVLARRNPQPQPLTFSGEWKVPQREHFFRLQSRVLLPLLQPGCHEEYLPHTIMPWTSPLKERESGGYSQVFEIDIHPDCHSFGRVLDSLSISGTNRFAVKKLTKSEKESKAQLLAKFNNEKDMLERFKGHSHLVTLLMTWTLKGSLTGSIEDEHYFLFPFAESDLDQYWNDANWKAVSSTDRTTRHEAIRWISKQIWKLTEALAHIHQPSHLLKAEKRFGRHGDLKPENILWYRSSRDPKGFLAIADFGLTACNSENSRSKAVNDTVGRTPGYRPPECDVNGGTISRSYDIWTLGCILLEMVCWVIEGPNLRDTFAEERMSPYYTGSQSDIFFDVEATKEPDTGYVIFVKDSVKAMIARLHGKERCTRYLHDLLDVIEHRMLVVICKEEGKIKDRITAKDLHDIMRNMNERVREPSYCLDSDPQSRNPEIGPRVVANLQDNALKVAEKLEKHTKLKVYSADRGPLHATLTPDEFQDLDGSFVERGSNGKS